MYYLSRHNHHHQICHQRPRDSLLCTLLLTVCILSALLCTAPQLSAAQSVYAVAQKLKLPEALQITTSTDTISITLNGNAVKPGDLVPTKQFKSFDFIRGVNWYGYYDKYTLMLVDLDRYPNTNATKIYNQFTSLNIPNSNVGSGQVIVPFEIPNIPCHPSAKHRIALLAFSQDDTIDLANVINVAAASGHPERRELSKFDEFVSKNRLTLRAANVFYASGEVNGICSAAATILPSVSTLSFIIVAMVMFQLSKTI